MRLIGVYLSPFVRRVAVSLNLLNLPFEHEDVFVFGEPETVRRYNPLVRIPVLATDDGEYLVESGAILDEIDHHPAVETPLTPRAGPQRRRVLQTCALAMGSAEKAQWAFYEDRVRPAEKVHAPWIAHNDGQVLGGFERLNDIAALTAGEGWMAGTATLSQADVTTSVAFTFAALARPGLALAERFPELARLAARCEDLPAFIAAPVPAGPKLERLLARPFVQ